MMPNITPEHLELYFDDFIATQPAEIACDFRTILGLVFCFDSPEFVEEIAKPNDALYKLYKDAEAYILNKLSDTQR